MFILQPVPEHPRRAVPALAARRPKPSALPRPIPRGPAPEPLVSVTSVTGWRPQVKDRDGGSRTLYSQIRDLMLYPMSYILAARDGTRTRDFRTLHPAFNRQTPRAIPTPRTGGTRSCSADRARRGSRARPATSPRHVAGERAFRPVADGGQAVLCRVTFSTTAARHFATTRVVRTCRYAAGHTI